MSESEQLRQERRLEEILDTDIDAVRKVQHIMRLGFSEEAATEMVERHEMGLQEPVYYERLNIPEYDEVEDEDLDRDLDSRNR